MKNLFPLIPFLFAASGFSQNLYQSLEFQQAFEKGTRKLDGTVSDEYWQNKSSYDIRVLVNPATRKVEASAKIWYYNISPDILDRIVFHSYKDLFKKGALNTQNTIQDFTSDALIYNSGMVIKNLVVDGKKIQTQDKRNSIYNETNYAVRLDNKLLPGDSVELIINWSIEIPSKVDRDGAYDETSMLVAYWYPEIAVYDDIFGWDNLVFDGSAEFYHDLSDFKVEIQIPDNFIVWSSLQPENLKNILPESIYLRWDKATKSSEKVVIMSPSEYPSSSKKSNIWKYEAKGLRDFVFSFSDHFVWEACTYTDAKGTFLLNSAYPQKNQTFSDVLAIEKEALFSFHNDFPAYPFPYNHFVAFNGENGGGMEFPGMCNDDARSNYTAERVPYSDYDANKLLTFHEMMHMYFPFLMGINEKRYAWMEEGMAEFSEDYFTGINLESVKSRSRFGQSTVAPMMVQTYMDSESSTNSYDIASQSYYALLHLLGKETFTKCLNGYMDRWKNKHPTPYDYFYSFNDLSGQDLNWFWKAWYFDWGYPDIAITGIENGKLRIDNLGGRPIAFSINYSMKDGTKIEEAISPIVWKNTMKYEHNIKIEGDIEYIELKTLNGSDAVLANNRWNIILK